MPSLAHEWKELKALCPGLPEFRVHRQALARDPSLTDFIGKRYEPTRDFIEPETDRFGNFVDLG